MPKQRNNVLARVRTLFEESNMSLVELGRKMGDEGDTARNSTWQFLNKTADPRLGSLLKNAILAFLNLAKCGAEPHPARKITTCVAILSSHPCDVAACRINQQAVSMLQRFADAVGVPPVKLLEK